MPISMFSVVKLSSKRMELTPTNLSLKSFGVAAVTGRGERMKRKRKIMRVGFLKSTIYVVNIDGMMKSMTLTPVKFWIKRRMSQETMMPTRPRIEDPKVAEAWATFFSSPPEKR